MRAYRCSHLLLPEGCVRDGAVAVARGRIVAAGPAAALRAGTAANAEWRDLGRAIVMPGLVNAHTHLELSWMGDERPAGGDYLAWLRGLVRLRDGEDEARARAAAGRACDALIARGTVAVGDICNRDWMADVWAGRPAMGVLFHELNGLDRAAERVAEARARIEARPAPDGWRWSLVPHGPHTTSPELLRLLAVEAARGDVPCSIHLAETAGERELAGRRSGPFRDFFVERGFLAAGAVPSGRTPLEAVADAGLLDVPTLLVHAVDLDDGEVARLGAARATIVSCPRSNAYLGVGVARVPELLAAGCRLALGTDSLATTPDLDLFAEMAALRRAYPTLAAPEIVRAATLGGARALALDGSLGTIAAGRRDLLTVVPFASGDDPYAFLCDLPERVSPLSEAAWEACR